MEIGYGTLEDALVDAFGLRPAQRPAFVGRLKYLARMGFPKAAKVGRGVRARYGLDDVLQLALTLELANVGVAPVPIVERVEGDWSDTRTAFARAWQMYLAPADERPLWAVRIAVLPSIGVGGAADAPKLRFVEEIDPAAFVRQRNARDGAQADRASRPFILVDPTRLLRDLLDGFGYLEANLAEAFGDAMGDLVAKSRRRITRSGAAADPTR